MLCLQIGDETAAREWLERYNQEVKDVASHAGFLAWNYATNVTDYNQKAQVRIRCCCSWLDCFEVQW